MRVAGVLSGFDHPSGFSLPHHIAAAYHSWPPHTVVHLVTRATLGIVAAGVNGICTTSAVPEKPGHASALCAHVSSASASLRARATVQIPPFHTFVCYPPSLTGGPGPPLSWTGRLTPGASVAWVPATVPGRAGWVRLHKGTNRIPRLLFRIRLLPSKPLCPFAFEPPRPLLFCADCSSPPAWSRPLPASASVLRP